MPSLGHGRCLPGALPGAPVKVAPTGFDFTGRMRAVCGDMIARLSELQHIDLRRVAISFSQARKRVSHGLYATLTPMRFEAGSLSTRRRGRQYTVQRLFDRDQREMLYILSFYLPRFMDLDFREKLVTILHELWHIGPDFDGDVRRHPGRCYAHTHSQAEYDVEMGRLADRYVSLAPPEAVYSFLHFNFDQLRHQHGRVFGVKVPHPKLIRIDAAT